MNVGIVTTWYERGASYVSKAYMHALEKKHVVYVYARGGHSYAKGDTEWDLPCVTWAPSFRGALRGSAPAISMTHFLRWLQDNSIDLVLFNEQHDIRTVKETANLGYIVGAYVDYYTAGSVKDFNTYDFLICNTKRHYLVLKNHRNCLFIQWGTDLALFRPRNKARRFCDTLTFFHSAGYGGVNLRKGTDLLVQSFGKVTGNVKLIIHSQAPLEKYSAVAVTIKKDPRIEFIEKTVSAPGLYHLGDVYVYPTKLEGIGLTIPEALASGLPVITTDNGPMNEFVIDGYNGMLVRVAKSQKRLDGYFWPESYVDLNDLRMKMQSYVDNPEMVDIHGRNARVDAKARFDWQKNSCALEKWIGTYKVDRTLSRIPYKRRLRWYGQDMFLITQRGISKIVKIIPYSFRKRLKTMLLKILPPLQNYF